MISDKIAAVAIALRTRSVKRGPLARTLRLYKLAI